MANEADRKQALRDDSAVKLGALVAYIKRLFSRDETTAAGHSALPAAAEAPPRPGAEKALAELQRGITKILSGGEARLKGAVHVIGLVSVREHYGVRWPEKAEKVHQVVHDCIRRRLAPADSCAPYKDEGYIIVFATIKDEAARLKCGLIAQEISKRLFGSNAPDRIDMAAVELSATGEVKLAPFAVEQVAARVRQDADAAGSVTEVAPARSQPSSSAPADDAAGDTVSDRRGVQAASLRIDSGRAPKPARDELQFVYRPMWQVRRKVVSAFICVPARVGADGHIRIGGAAMPLGHASPENAILDFQTLRRVLKDYQRLLAEDKGSILVVPVHYITLNDNRLLAPFAELCNRIPQGARGLLIFELIGLPANLPTPTIVQTLTRLRPFSRAVLIRRRLDSDDQSKLKALGAYGVGVEISTIQDSESEIIAAMQGFNEKARAAGLPTYVHGLRSLSLISAAAGAGFKFVDGDPIMSVLDMPQSVSPFDIDSLYAPLLTAHE